MAVYSASLKFACPDGPAIAKLIGLSATVWTEGYRQVATGTSNSALAFGPVTTASILYIESDQTISLKQVSGDTAITITAGGFVLLFNTSATAYIITNASGSTANVHYVIAGA